MAESQEPLPSPAGVLGIFDSLEALPEAVRRVRKAGFTHIEAYLPVSDKAAAEALHPGDSFVRYICAAGGFMGIGAGLMITIWPSRDYPLVTGGKPIVSLPPFLVATFEVTMVLAALAAVAGFLWLARLPHLAPSDAYGRAAAIDTYTLFLPCETPSERILAERLLRQAGAREVRTVEKRNAGPLEDVP